ncbi:MAG: hypothetical protein ACLTYP_10965 [Eubacterium sp.]|jgi:hypothetical protein|uniref:hypothetical protein n=1 Tax=Eubacterium sp. TaxID=142586 RepID=UPI002672644D|nr:hypothetical protein [uncultured Eubacterium sp.]
MKIKKLSIFVLIFILCLSGCAGTKKVKYQSGRDTYLSVGDGRFQMMSSFDYTIYDLKEDESVFDKITFYYDDSKESKLYLVNENNNYMIIDYKNNSYKSYDKSNLSNELKKIFDSTKMIKLKKINYETLGSDEPALIIDN